MAPRIDDFSDSDDDDDGGVETSVLLGIPDGLVDNDKDLADAAVSRLGGLPAFICREPPYSSSHCKVCSEPMELLVQMWCPFEDSPMDRALYVWGCSRNGCQGKDGSIRAWRGLRHNERYAAKLERKRQQAREKARIDALKNEQAAARALVDKKQRETIGKPNPFSMGKASANPFAGPFAFGTTPTATTTTTAAADADESAAGDIAAVVHEEEESGSESDSDESLLTALEATTLSDSPWRTAPAYPPIYLSTEEEYLPVEALPKPPKDVKVEEVDSVGGVSCTTETYEDSMELDHVFEKFAKRVNCRGEQCVRYDLAGTPLPYGSDKVFDLLWPRRAAGVIAVTQAAVTAPAPAKREYDASAVPRCEGCGGARVFECQLMPNLIGTMRTKDDRKLNDEERREQIARALRRENLNEKTGMEWGTAMIFSCNNDECRESWREELVYTEWET